MRMKSFFANSLEYDMSWLTVLTLTVCLLPFGHTMAEPRQLTMDDGLPSNTINIIKQDRRGFIWIGTDHGLSRYDGNQLITYSSADQVIEHKVIDITLADDGDLYILSPQGVSRFSFATETFDEAEKADSILKAWPGRATNTLRMSDGSQWKATEDRGLLLMRNDGEEEPMRARQELHIHLLFELSVHQLLLGCDDGLWIFDTVQRSYSRYCNQQFVTTVERDKEGGLWIGTMHDGISYMPPQHADADKAASVQSPVFITLLEIENHPIPVGNWHLPKALSVIDKLDLYNDDDMFCLSFASLSYCAPEKNMYAYMLEGYDKNWNYVGHDHKATYTSLPAGKYTFRVKATNSSGVWSDNEARLNIEIHPPFWLTIYAKIFYVLVFIGLIALFIRFLLLMVERRHRKEMHLLSEAKEQEVRDARIEFFTMIAHEIRTPVSLIIGPLENLLNRERPQDSPFWKQDAEDLKVIDRNARRLLELVNQLLDFRKVEQQKISLDLAPHNMSELMRSVASNFAPAFKRRGVKLTVDYPDENFTAVIDREAVVKVISNLLSNAGKYAKDSVSMGCKMLADGKNFCIEVTDNGNGISEADQQHLFEAFFQARNKKAGTGIGLNIVKRIVEAHHGQVTVESHLGTGTKFRVVMPLAQEYSGEKAVTARETAMPATTGDKQEPGQAPADAVEKKPVMMIVDDNEEMLTFLVTTFMDRYEVISAHDGTETLKMLEDTLIVKDGRTPSSTVDVIISDWMMTQMDGPELCSRMRQNAATRHIPFILLTAKTDSQSKVQAMQAGVDAFIEKPFAVKYLEACILNLLNRRFKQ
jgi:signal transduction histidine kinase/ActR/RegA family two-component response regulator